jgi:hypothetical protein
MLLVKEKICKIKNSKKVPETVFDLYTDDYQKRDIGPDSLITHQVFYITVFSNYGL